MKRLILIALCLVTALSSWAQELFDVKGTIQTVSYSQGGVELPPEYTRPYPTPNQVIYIVKYNGPDSLPTVIEKVTTDSLGVFKSTLPAGKYGFTLSHKKRNLEAGKYLPKTYADSIDDRHDKISYSGTSKQEYWYMNQNGPWEVGSDKDNTVVLTHHNVTICYMCP